MSNLRAVHPAPSDETVLALFARHGLPGGPVEASPHEGSVNHVRMVGDLCLRVLKVEDYASDIYTETVSVPAVRSVGVSTPELIAFDDSRSIVPGLVTIYRRAPGIPLGTAAPLAGIECVVHEIGTQIALWRKGIAAIEDPHGRLDRPRGDDAWACYERVAERLSPEERVWTESTIRRLESAREPAAEFVHWDLHAFNVLVEDGRFVAVLDWGDAGFGDPALNYRLFPAVWLPRLLELTSDGADFVGRCLFHLLAYALNGVHSPHDERPYANAGHRRWESLQALARSAPTAWRDWLGDGPPHENP